VGVPPILLPLCFLAHNVSSFSPLVLHHDVLPLTKAQSSGTIWSWTGLTKPLLFIN
jgi:hypothetical protein